MFCAFLVVFCVFENAGAPSPAWPLENDHSQLQVANVTIAVEIAPGRLTLSRDQVLAWISEAARAVVHYYGRFPVSQLQILVFPCVGKGHPPAPPLASLTPASQLLWAKLPMKSFCVGIG